MNFFKVFSKRDPVVHLNAANGHNNGVPTSPASSSHLIDANSAQRPDVPEKVFVEYERPQDRNMEEEQPEPDTIDIHSLYGYIGSSFEKRGYEDALINPDSSYMEEHCRALVSELNIMISKIRISYTNRLRIIDFHIETRKRLGLIEVVEELQMQRANLESELKSVLETESEAKLGVGISQAPALSYRRGFLNGLSAITYGTIFGKRS